MDFQTTGGGGLPAPSKMRDGNGGRGLIIGLAGCWAAGGLYVAPLETIAWVACVAAIVALAWVWAQYLDRRVYERVEKGLCAQCGYDLQGCGQSGECPECGGWFGPGWGAAIPKRKAAKREETNPEADAAAAAQTDSVEHAEAADLPPSTTAS